MSQSDKIAESATQCNAIE